jgi:hypothetical protein
MIHEIAHMNLVFTCYESLAAWGHPGHDGKHSEALT